MENTAQSQPVVQQPTPMPVPQPTSHTPPPSAGPSKIFLFALVFVLLAGASAVAYFLGMQNSQPVNQPVTTAPIVIKPTPTVDPTANWQTYTNVKYEFSLKYPSTFQIDDRSTQFPPFTIYIQDKSKETTLPTIVGKISPSLMISAKSSKLSLTDYVNDPKNNLSLVSTKTLGNNDFVTANEKLGMGVGPYYLIKDGNNIVSILNSPQLALDNTVFNQILSTFTFTTASPMSGTSQTQAIDTSSWKTYTIKTVGLSLKLPPSLSKLTFKEEVVPGQQGTQLCFYTVDQQIGLVQKAYAGGGCFSNNPIFQFGTTSIDYEAGREGAFTDFQGYILKNGKYVAKFVKNGTYELPSDLVTEITNPQGIKILIVKGSNFQGPSALPYTGYEGAIINTSNTVYTGLSLLLKLTDDMDENIFNQILSTFTFTK